jgi:hypothetical protein
MHEGDKKLYEILVGKPDWKKPLGTPNVDVRVILDWIIKK